MNILEMRDAREVKMNELRIMSNNLKTEKRKFSEEEQVEFDAKGEEVKQLNEDVKLAEEADKQEILKNKIVVKPTIIQETKMEKRFSISCAIRESLEGKFSDNSLAVIKEGQELLRNTNTPQAGQFAVPWKSFEDEKRAGQAVDGDGDGGYSVYEEPWDLIKPLTDSLVLVQAGAKMHTNLSGGDLSILSITSPTVSWAPETGSASDTSSTFSETTFSPKRLTAIVPISRQLINQSSYAVDEIIKEELVRQIAIKVEGALFASESLSNACTSLMAPTFIDSGSAATFAKVVAMETEVAGNNNLFGKVAYITNSTGMGKLKSTLKVANSGSLMLVEHKELNGYPIYSTNAIKSTYGGAENEYGVLFGNIEDVHIFNFGAVDVIVDQLTLAGAGQIRLVINAYFDAGTFRSTSLTAASYTV